MSFGFSIGDLATLITLTKKTYDSWSQAPKEYADVVRTLRESTTLLCHVQTRFDALTGLGENDSTKQEEIESLLKGCQSAISELRAVVKRRRKLGHWDRIRLGSSGSHVHECRARLARHISILTPFLFSLELESIGKDVGCLPAILDRLPQAVTNALPAALGKMIDERIEDSQTARGSVMTTYGDDDDKQAYKELRRNLRFFGIKDAVVRQQRAKLVEFIKTLTEEDRSTTLNEAANGDQRLSGEQVTSVPSPVLVPLVVDSAEDVEIALEPLVGTSARRQYQSYVETENEDDPMESPIARPRNGSTARRPDNTKGSTVSSDEADGVDEAETEAKDTPDTGQVAGETPGVREDAAARKGRRKYQAYVESEDEEETPKTPSKSLPDSSGPAVSDVWPQKSQAEPMTGTKEHPLSSTEPDDATPPPTPDENANTIPKTRRYTLPHRTSEATDRPKSQPKHEPSWRRKGSPAPAVCGDWGYQKCLDSSSSDSEDSTSIATRASRRDSYCSSCDQQLTSGDEASWEQLSNDGSGWSDSEQQHSETHDDASKIAHSGDTDSEEAFAAKAYDARRFKKSQKRARPTPKPNTLPFPPPPDVGTAAPRRTLPQRMIEYKPLQVSEEGLLTIQLHMPAGYSIHVEGGRIAQFHNRFAPNMSRQYFPTLPPNKEFRPSCLHRFPCAPPPGWIDFCGCQVFYWTPELQHWNPSFVDGLREWVKV
jgi:hypothetical protein